MSKTLKMYEICVLIVFYRIDEEKSSRRERGGVLNLFLRMQLLCRGSAG